jgi:UDP-N-acetylglucosamine 2-epimerase (non-hydrolysing)
MKAAPVFRAIAKYDWIEQFLVHTGQHYDVAMSDVFFQELGLPEPNVNLEVGSGSHAQQTSQIMSRFEPVVIDVKPDWVVVYGDVNSTIAAALVCAKLGVRVAHVEAGLRSYDREMPEEINRILTDQLADLLLTPSADADENLSREGIPTSKVRLVGNVMIDTLLRMLPKAQEQLPHDLPSRYVLLTLHRPSNVDDLPWLKSMLETLSEISTQIPILFPVHPRTRQQISQLGVFNDDNPNLRMLPPAPYLQFLALQSRATVVITDSGGIQEETSVLRVPCVTVRENTERPVTVTMGTNVLVGRDTKRLKTELVSILEGKFKQSSIPPLWDGCAAERIAEILARQNAKQHCVGV